MTKKLVAILVLCMLCACCAFGFTACQNPAGIGGKDNGDNSGEGGGGNTNPAGHTHSYVKGICTICGDIQITPDEYFAFIYLEETDSYSIKAKDKNTLPEHIALPSEHNGKKVTHIGYDLTDENMYEWIDKNTTILNADYAFVGCLKLKSVIIPNSVTNIGTGAFFNCVGLSKLVIGENVISIWHGAFDGCESLLSITIPDSVTSIGNEVFEECGNVTTVVIGDGLKILNYEAFCGCFKLTKVTIGKNVSEIKGSAFRGCSILTDIIFKGSKAEWNAIIKDNWWNDDVPATVVHCTDGDVEI